MRQDRCWSSLGIHGCARGEHDRNLKRNGAYRDHVVSRMTRRQIRWGVVVDPFSLWSY